jgi:hypothetical protein
MAKPSITSILSDKDAPEPDEDDASAGDGDGDPKQMAFEALCDAIKEEDYASGASALEHFIQLCQSSDGGPMADHKPSIHMIIGHHPG